MPDPRPPFSLPLGFGLRGVMASGWRQADLRTRVLVVLLAILAIPILILLTVAAIAIVLVMSILATAAALVRRFTGPRPMGGNRGFGRSEGRENVRVIRRDEIS